MPKINVIKPSYYDTFQCIGGTCRQSCCSNWNITLSKEEFKKTKKALKSDMIKEIFSNEIERKWRLSFFGRAKIMLDL